MQFFTRVSVDEASQQKNSTILQPSPEMLWEL